MLGWRCGVHRALERGDYGGEMIIYADDEHTAFAMLTLCDVTRYQKYARRLLSKGDVDAYLDDLANHH